MFDLVPLARPRRVVANGDLEAGFISELLQVQLPGAAPTRVGASTVCTEQQPLGRIVMVATDLPPPFPDRVYSEFRGLMRDAYTDEPFVTLHVERTVGNSRPNAQTREVIDVDVHRIAQFTPGFSGVFELSYAFLLLAIDREHGVAHLDEFLDLRVDVAK